MSTPSTDIYTIGYRGYPTKRRIQTLIQKLVDAGIEQLIDTRHSPCSSNPKEGTNYGPKAWNLQCHEDGGLTTHLEAAGIAYLWLVELGNPQKNDPEMAILKEHISSRDMKWPVNRGLQIAIPLIENKRSCLLCACKDPQSCHRNVIAQALQERWDGHLQSIHL